MQDQVLVDHTGPTVIICENGFSGDPCIMAVMVIANMIITIVTIVKKSGDGLKLNDDLMLKEYLTIVSQCMSNI